MPRIFIVTFFIFLLTGCVSDFFDSSDYQTKKDSQDYQSDKGTGYFATTRVATGRDVFIFNPNYGAWALYDENGLLVNTGRASGGKDYCPDIHRNCKTIIGTYHVISKGGSDCISTKFPLETHGGAPMPYCMYFHPAGYAIHGSYDVPDYNASHGCIRVTPEAAEWLSDNYLRVGSTVIILPY
jgi:lipoprotein-anchoring transpeptidase ErfK/SrfK